MEHSDGITKKQYQKDAMKIAEIQKGILATSQNEEPFDVFICYKESDEAGQRTVDSTLAQDIYYQLSDAGYRVFFSRITLEDKVGTQYEPYIFAALNSAKVMIVVGTKADYLNAVWVKNEWSRFLVLMKKDRSKLLLPCYRDMDPYDMPEALSVLQSYDMGKIGFVQDLIRGIKKVITSEQDKAVEKETVAVQASGSANNNITALLKRGNMALEDGEWKKAEEFFEEVLNQDAECAEAYYGEMLAGARCSNITEFIEGSVEDFREENDPKLLVACEVEQKHIDEMVEKYSIKGYLAEDTISKQYGFDRRYESKLSMCVDQKEYILSDIKNNKLYLRTLQYAKGSLKDEMIAAFNTIEAKHDEMIQEEEAKDKASILSKIAEYKAFIKKADESVLVLYNSAYDKRDAEYQEVVNKMNSAQTVDDYSSAKDAFKKFKDYKDAEKNIAFCQREIDKFNEAERKSAERALKILNRVGVVAVIVVILAVVGVLIAKNMIIPNNKYNQAGVAFAEGRFDDAISLYASLGDYKDAKEQITESKYQKANALLETGEYDKAMVQFQRLANYKDSYEQISECKYQKANKLLDEGKGEEAIEICESIEFYKDSYEQISEYKYQKANKLFDEGETEEAIEIYRSIKSYKDSEELIRKYCIKIIQEASVGDEIILGDYNGNKEWKVLAKEDGKALIISKFAIDLDAYNLSSRRVVWEDCSLRSWLNETYISEAFNPFEQSLILATDVVNSDNEEFDIDAGVDTIDRVFLLSIDEANQYFENDDDRKAYLSDGTNIGWWLRSPGMTEMYAANILKQGSVSVMGYSVNVIDVGVRPAMWIDIPDK